jgi:hypothetical protein
VSIYLLITVSLFVALQALLVSAASVRKMQNAISTASKAPHTS